MLNWHYYMRRGASDLSTAVEVVHRPFVPIWCRSGPRCGGTPTRLQARQHIAAAASMHQLPELVYKLRDIIQADCASTRFPPEALPVLEDIDSVVLQCGVPQVTQCIVSKMQWQLCLQQHLHECCAAAMRSLTLSVFISTQIPAEGIRGRFRQMLNNTNFVDAESTLTLGVLTFKQFGPTDLKVQIRYAAVFTR